MITAFGTVLFHALFTSAELPSYKPISAITKLPPPALSANFLEPRFRIYRDYRDHFYPKMQPIDYLGFVYAK